MICGNVWFGDQATADERLNSPNTVGKLLNYSVRMALRVEPLLCVTAYMRYFSISVFSTQTAIAVGSFIIDKIATGICTSITVVFLPLPTGIISARAHIAACAGKADAIRLQRVGYYRASMCLDTIAGTRRT